MFEGFLKSKFLTKCKSALKLTKVRIEGIKRKRNAMQNYLKNDISDLLKNGFHLNAYGRTEGLLIEMNKSSCYDFIEQFCNTISHQLSVMNKQKECPEECKESIASLMFAAARFADLPELRELRTIFADKYGKSLDAHVNQEFMEKLKTSSPTKDMKLQLLQDIATEYGVEWDAKSLENQLYKPSVTEQVWSKNRLHSEKEIKKSRNISVRERDKREIEINDDTSKLNEKHVFNDDKYEKRDIEIKGNNDATDDKKPVGYRFVPPPYTKSKSNDAKTTFENNFQDDAISEKAKQKPKSVRSRQPKPPPGRGGTNLSDGDEKEKSAGSANEDDNLGLKVVLEDNGEDRKGNKSAFHSRTISLPLEEIRPKETKKGHNRAFSYQSDTEHANPKLLDYDDFVARLAALRQN